VLHHCTICYNNEHHAQKTATPGSKTATPAVAGQQHDHSKNMPLPTHPANPAQGRCMPILAAAAHRVCPRPQGAHKTHRANSATARHQH
jgi:hypothetical protein